MSRRLHMQSYLAAYRAEVTSQQFQYGHFMRCSRGSESPRRNILLMKPSAAWGNDANGPKFGGAQVFMDNHPRRQDMIAAVEPHMFMVKPLTVQVLCLCLLHEARFCNADHQGQTLCKQAAIFVDWLGLLLSAMPVRHLRTLPKHDISSLEW